MDVKINDGDALIVKVLTLDPKRSNLGALSRVVLDCISRDNKRFFAVFLFVPASLAKPNTTNLRELREGSSERSEGGTLGAHDEDP